jgi:Tfp pilus assembly protein PilX
MRLNTTPLRTSQSGFALVVALLLMVALSFIGVTALRNVSLQEKMAGNFFFRLAMTHESEGAQRTAIQRTLQITAAGLSGSAGDPPEPVNQASVAYWSNPANWATVANSTSLSTLRPADTKALLEAFPGENPLAPSNVGNSSSKVNYFRTGTRTVEAATGATVIVQQWSMQPRE